MPLHECIILELRESGYAESSSYLQDLIYDNVQLLEEDELGIVVDLRKRPDYLNHIYPILQKAEREHDKGSDTINFNKTHLAFTTKICEIVVNVLFTP